MEYLNDGGVTSDYFALKIDNDTVHKAAIDTFSENASHNLKHTVGVVWDFYPGVSGNDRILQACQDSPSCGEDQSAGNHWEGANKNSIGFGDNPILNTFWGGETEDGQRWGWIRRHPQANQRKNTAVAVVSHANSPENFQKYTVWPIRFKPVGWTSTQIPVVEPRKGYTDQVVVYWDNPIRYIDNSDGHVEDSATPLPAHQKDNNGVAENGYTYLYTLEWTDNLSDWSAGDTRGTSWTVAYGVDQASNRYIHPIGYYEPDNSNLGQKIHTVGSLLEYAARTPVYFRIKRVESRFGIDNTYYTPVVAYFMGEAMTATSDNDSITVTWEETYTNGTIDRYQYRIGYEEGRELSERNSNEELYFNLRWRPQTDWLDDWIDLCAGKVEGTGSTKTLSIEHTEGLDNGCGPDLTSALEPGKEYRVQVRGIDDDKDDIFVRNYVLGDRIAITAPVPTTAPPSTAPPSTSPSAFPTPQNPQVSPGDGFVTITWDPVDPGDNGITSMQYRIVEQPEPLPSGWMLDWAGVSFTDLPVGVNARVPPDSGTTLASGRTYHVQIRLGNPGGYGSPVTATFTYSPPTTSPPVAFPPPVPSGGPPPSAGGNESGGSPTDQETSEFADTSGSVHESNIVQLADMGVTRGCNPPTNTRFCPDRAVTRGEMATFLVRAFDLPPTDDDPFEDTAGNVHRTNINRMAAAGISRGCNPPTNTRFCPDRAVTRAEMATFMTRVLDLEEEGSGFTDTEGNVHAANIQRFAEAGITRGCNPPSNTRYCPDRAVTRAEMATFLVRSTALNSG